MIGNPALPIVAEALGKGFGGFDRDEALRAMVDTATRDRLIDALRQRGLLAGGSGSQSVRFRPALVYGPRHVAETLDLFESALGSLR